MKLSIVTAVHNRQTTIAQAIASVSAQSYQDVEHLIIDGASKDGTMREVNRVKHPKMRVISEPDQGIYDALNKGIRHATGEVVGLMHSDDFFAHDQVLEKVALAFASTGADAVWTIEDLSLHSTVSSRTIKRIEGSDEAFSANMRTIVKIKASLEAAGLEFVGTPGNAPSIRVHMAQSQTSDC